ncbi:MAG: translation initiation factor IF-1 [Verrucomicrobiaceae bacterium]|jgi:translation initiation factor IF-1|nr:translation initiation factor IF-1 [Verrucomicrobiaceae bacterium]|tara:strand:- start:20 stop:247 length:228 start_codon:yes stop_codon:yes gene_type:complete
MSEVENPEIFGSAKIIEKLESRLFKASLPNGKIIHAHFSKSDTENIHLEVGDLIKVKMNPYDFSRARIVTKLKLD